MKTHPIKKFADRLSLQTKAFIDYPVSCGPGVNTHRAEQAAEALAALGLIEIVNATLGHEAVLTAAGLAHFGIDRGAVASAVLENTEWCDRCDYQVSRAVTALAKSVGGAL